MRHTPVSDRRAERARRTRPAVVVLHQVCPDNRCCLREINAGMEEEGVPFRVEEAQTGSAAELAHAAAHASTLDVGVGVDAAGNICVHHAKLPPDAPALTGPPQHARSLGHNAARLVTGIPFKNVAQ
jgi:propanediol dehydratase-reactivating factor small subunit